MTIDERYCGNYSYAIAKNPNGKYFMMKANNLNNLDQDLHDLRYLRILQLEVFARFEGVNARGRWEILNSIRDLNQGIKLKKKLKDLLE